jgi:FlaA1/EpsC-like NDP-sugar epimerase
MLDRLSGGQKLFIAMLADAVTASVALLFSYWIIELTVKTEVTNMWWLLPASSVVTVSTFYFWGLYRTILRFSNSRFFINVIIHSLIVTGLVTGIAYLSLGNEPLPFPRRVFLLFAITLSVGAACSRLFARTFFDRRRSKTRAGVVIYGAGSGGNQLFSAIRYGWQYAPVAFIDDDPAKHGKLMHGLRVLPFRKLEPLIKSKGVKTVLLAMPALSQDKRAEIISKLQQYKVSIKTTPRLSELISGKASLGDIHNLSIEDLMARPTVQADEDLASQCVSEKSVLVTGAGGSIGSELCRQILLRKPKTIVLFEMTESSLFYIEQELITRVKNLGTEAQIVAVLGSVLDANRLKETMYRHKVDTVFHAAAYKHVPMLEANQVEGVRNNVIGTKRVAESCAQCGVDSLVVVSTDKAVRPTNLMGATKRFAELVVQAVANSNKQMNTCMVRFGNVLGSSGSVVPTFQEQIRCGGPVTVTHTKMTRYFMTIPEASQLVMQAGAMANNGEVFVLDMGKPERIYDLAKRMIKLSGFQPKDAEHPSGDIEIVFTGLRPGEKMFEELSINGHLEPTTHPKICQSIERVNPHDRVLHSASLLEAAIESGSEIEVLNILKQEVPEYEQSAQLKTDPLMVVVPAPQEASSKNTGNV